MYLVEIFTDGAISKNGKEGSVGGWGAVLIVRGAESKKELWGSKTNTTNNEMELMACYEALSRIKGTNHDVHLYSDSQYVVNTFNKWLDVWINTGRLKGRPNIDLILDIQRLSQKHNVKWHWIKGHAGHEYNERADQLAVQAKEGKI